MIFAGRGATVSAQQAVAARPAAEALLQRHRFGTPASQRERQDDYGWQFGFHRL
jgi:hypothetical protein